MIAQRGATAEAIFNAVAVLADTPASNCAWLERDDLKALLDYIEDLEFGMLRLTGTFIVLDEH